MTISVTLYLSELVYDIQNKGYNTRLSRDGKTPDLAARLQPSDDEPDANQIYRSLGTALQILKSELCENLRESGQSADNILMPSSTNPLLVFDVPSNYNLAARIPLSNAIHAYLVNRAIAEWFQITDKEDAKEYYEGAAYYLEYAKSCLLKRVRPVRPSSGSSVQYGYWGYGLTSPTTREAVESGTLFSFRGNTAYIEIETEQYDHAKCHWVAIPDGWAVVKVVDVDGDDITDMFTYVEMDDLSLYSMTLRGYISNKSVFTLKKSL